MQMCAVISYQCQRSLYERGKLPDTALLHCGYHRHGDNDNPRKSKDIWGQALQVNIITNSCIQTSGILNTIGMMSCKNMQL